MPDTVPVGLRGPVDVVLARAQEVIPLPGALPGGGAYEPKWDGYRLVVVRTGEGARLWSRQGKDLTGRFPDLVRAVEDQVAPGVVLDGEVVVWAGDRLSFTELQRRLITSPRAIHRVAASAPVSYAAFDLLAVGGHDLRPAPLSARRDALQGLGDRWAPPLNVSPLTTDVDVARGWFEALTTAGIEGLVVKGLGQPYRGGRRDWVKVKHREAVDVVCAAVLGPVSAPTVVVAGLPLEGRLRIVGRTTPLQRASATALGRVLVPASPQEHPWPVSVSSAVVNGFGADREPVQLTLVEPVVVEVAADVAWSGRSFRHPLRYLRVRLDVSPEDVHLPAVGH